MPIVLRQCKTKAGYEALPVDAKTGKWDQERRMNLRSVARSLEALGYDVTDAGPLLVVKGKGLCETTVYQTGRLMIKSNDEAQSRSTAQKIYKDIGLEE
jgi:hypothetical protein